MLAIYTFIPHFCPSCGTSTRLDRLDNAIAGMYRAHQAITCPICRVMYQLADKVDVLRATTASDGDMVE